RSREEAQAASHARGGQGGQTVRVVPTHASASAVGDAGQRDRMGRDPQDGRSRLKIKPASGGSVRLSENRCPWAGIGSASTPPALPTLLPPYKAASLFTSSR